MIKIKEYQNSLKTYFKTSILLVVFVVTNLLNCYLLRITTLQDYFSFRSIFGDFMVLLFLGVLGYIFHVKIRFRYLFIISIIISVILIGNAMYFTFFQSYISVSLISTSMQVVDVGDAVVENVMELDDFLFLWQPIALYLIHLVLKKKSYYTRVASLENKYKRLSNSMIVVFLAFIIFIITLTTYEVSKFQRTWNKKYIVSNFGIMIYQVNDIIINLNPDYINPIEFDKAYKEFNDFVDKQEKKSNDYSGIFENKNIIMIHAESIQNLAMNKSYNNREVTPNLNKLAKEGLYFSNYYSPISVGSSSDAEFSLLTSLMPANQGTIFMSHTEKTFVALPQLLTDKGYYTFSMHGNVGTFWNRNVMHEKLGYQKFYEKDSYVIDEVIGLGLSDESFFRQSKEIIKNNSQEKKPFMVNLIMLTNHTPFDDVDLLGETLDLAYYYNDPLTNELLSYPYLEDTKIGNYFKSVNYADRMIGQFIENLDKDGLLDNTIVVIYGDHDSRLNVKEFDILNNYDFTTGKMKDKNDPTYIKSNYYQNELNRKVPFIIWSKDKKYVENVTTPMSSLDVLPTLGNMLNIYNPYSLGTDIFSNADNVVLFPNGSWLNKDIYYNTQLEEYYNLDTNSTINKKNIDDIIEKMDKKMILADNIIKYDLIKKRREDEMIHEK